MRFERLASYVAPKRKHTQLRGNLKFEITVKGNARKLIRAILHTVKHRVEAIEGTEAYINVREDRSLTTSVFYIQACRVTISEAGAIKKVAEQIFSGLQEPAYFYPKGIVV